MSRLRRAFQTDLLERTQLNQKLYIERSESNALSHCPVLLLFFCTGLTVQQDSLNTGLYQNWAERWGKMGVLRTLTLMPSTSSTSVVGSLVRMHSPAMQHSYSYHKNSSTLITALGFSRFGILLDKLHYFFTYFTLVFILCWDHNKHQPLQKRQQQVTKCCPYKILLLAWLTHETSSLSPLKLNNFLRKHNIL